MRRTPHKPASGPTNAPLYTGLPRRVKSEGWQSDRLPRSIAFVADGGAGISRGGLDMSDRFATTVDGRRLFVNRNSLEDPTLVRAPETRALLRSTGPPCGEPGE